MIPFLDLKQQYQGIKDEVLEAVAKTFENTAFVLGPDVAAFEETFAKYAGAKHAVGHNSGTAALHMALLAMGVGEGDEVITIPHTFVATVAAIMYTNAKPVFVDVDPDSYTMDPSKIEAAITSKTKAIMPVHLYGQPADMDPIMEIANKHGLMVLEDAAQAHGAEYKGKRIGSIGTAAGFSFYPGKNLGAYGEGGATTTNDDGINERLRILRDWGQKKKYYHEVLGYNARLEGVQGAVLNIKMKYIEGWTERRRAIAKTYDEAFAGLKHVKAPKAYADRRHVYHLYVVLVEDRDGFMNFCKERNVGTAIHYPFAIHTLGGYDHLGNVGDFPVSEHVAARCVSLPMFPELTDDQAKRVIEVVHEYEAHLGA